MGELLQIHADAGDEELDPKTKEVNEGFRQATLLYERKRFTAADDNKDGKLSKAEFSGFRTKRYAHIDKEMIDEWSALEVKQVLVEHDANSDGHLDKSELEQAHDSLWYMTHPPELRDEL